MNTETMLARILPAVETLIKESVGQVDSRETPATLYEMEEKIQVILPQIGHILLHEIVHA